MLRLESRGWVYCHSLQNSFNFALFQYFAYTFFEKVLYPTSWERRENIALGCTGPAGLELEGSVLAVKTMLEILEELPTGLTFKKPPPNSWM